MGNELQKLHMGICTSAVFRGVLSCPIFTLFARYCKAEGQTEKLNAYAEFVARERNAKSLITFTTQTYGFFIF